MRNLIFVFLGFFFFSGCELYEQIDVLKVGKIRLDKINSSNATINIDVEVDNPNFYGIKLKPSSLDVFIEEEYLGKAHLLDAVKFKRKKTGVYNFKVELLGETGVLKKAVKYSMMKEIKVRLAGTVKASVLGISKKIAVNETKTIDGAKLRLSLPMFN